MSPLIMLASLIALLVVLWALWFVIGFIRYILSGEYEMDKRLREIVR